MSEQNASVQDGRSISRRISRRRKKSPETQIDPAVVREKESEVLRARSLIKLNDKSPDNEPSVPEGPSIAGRRYSEEVRKLLNEKRQQERTRAAKRQEYERGVAERARAKLLGKDSELIKDLPEAKKEPSEIEELPEAEPIPEKIEHEKSPDKAGTVILPRRGSTRLTSRSVILRAPGNADAKAAGSQRVDSAAKSEDKTQGTRLVFKLAGVLLLLFFVLLGVRWAAKGKAPTDLVTVEGQRELAGDTLATMHDLQKFLGGNAPETEEDSARLVDESKELVEGAPHAEAEHAAPPPAPKAAPQPTVAPKPKVSAPPAPSRPGRSAEPLPRTFTNKDPLLGAARDVFNQANVFYIKADPRVAEFEAIQKNIRLAAPLFERCLDECAKARKKGARGSEIDTLEQSAAMRLYDCNKRAVLRP